MPLQLARRLMPAHVTANQLYRRSKDQGGHDLRRYLHALSRTAIDAGRVLLEH